MKIEDLTLKQIKEICATHSCDDCPLYGWWKGKGYRECIANTRTSPIFWSSEDMEREVKPNE